jgi:hypothetical protein
MNSSSVVIVAQGFQTSHVYDYVAKLCRRQAEDIQNHEDEHVRGTGQVEGRHRKYKRLKLGGGQAYGRSSIKLPLYKRICKINIICSVNPVLTEDLHIVQKE